MGWLFNKKATPKVPFPEGRAFDEKALRFAPSAPRERVIQPEQIKQAAGLGKPLSFPDNFEMSLEGMEMNESKETVMPVKAQGYSSNFEIKRSVSSGPTFVKVEVYQQLLTEIDGLKSSLSTLLEASRNLEKSEYNEESSLEKLRRDIKNVHDKLLHVDKKLFKYQGE